jgi:hypothetical protein
LIDDDNGETLLLNEPNVRILLENIRELLKTSTKTEKMIYNKQYETERIF